MIWDNGFVIAAPVDCQWPNSDQCLVVRAEIKSSATFVSELDDSFWRTPDDKIPPIWMDAEKVTVPSETSRAIGMLQVLRQALVDGDAERLGQLNRYKHVDIGGVMIAGRKGGAFTIFHHRKIGYGTA